MTDKIKVAIMGATGYAGAELVRFLSRHPKAEITALSSRQYAGRPFSEIYPAMYNIVDMPCEDFSVDAIVNKAEVFFLALPHKLSMNTAKELAEYGKKIIDLSADFRFKNALTYKSFYEEHTAAELLKKAVYGLSEVYFEKIKDSSLIGNPGCYPTSVLLPLIPLIRENLILPKTIIADSKSGASGAGRSASIATLFCEVNEGFKAYKVSDHRHTPEMEEVLSNEAGKDVKITFTPHLVPINRGILTTTYANINENVKYDHIKDCLSSFYNGKNFVRICKGEQLPNVMYVQGTNYCDIGFRIENKTNRLILISAIDNLVKGAAGQAIQNMNIMLGLPETTGLN